MNKNINGIENELEFVNYLDGKRINELYPTFQELFKEVFKNIKTSDKIKAWKNSIPQKTDIFIKINNDLKRISIKKGIKNSVHMEPISEFIHFLIKNKVERNIIIAYLKYHYADGTTNGSGLIRQSVSEYKIKNQAEIDKINKAFNNKKLVIKAINRFILQGRNDKETIDLIIYGFVEDFVWISKEEIIEIVLEQIDNYSTGVHFGPISCQPLNRCLNYNKRYEYGRYCVQLKWYNLYDDILKIMIERENNRRLKIFFGDM